MFVSLLHLSSISLGLTEHRLVQGGRSLLLLPFPLIAAILGNADGSGLQVQLLIQLS